MVTKLHKDDTILYACDACGFTYREKELAEKCELWCKEHQSCNLEITQHSVALDNEE
jgi:hypothetical protein